MSTETIEKETGLSKLSAFDTTKAELEKFVSDYKNLIVTPETYEASKKAHLAIRSRRYEIQAIEKSNNNQLNALKKQNTSNAEELIAVLTEVEDTIHAGIEAIEDAKEKEKKDKLAKAEEKYNNRIAGLLKAGAGFDGVTYSLGIVSAESSAVRTLGDDDFAGLLQSFLLEAEIIAKYAERRKSMVKAGMIESTTELSYPIDLFPNNPNVIYMSAINACTDDEFGKLLNSVSDEISKAREVMDAIRKAAAELKTRTEGRIHAISKLGCVFTGTGYNYGIVEVVLQSELQDMDAESWCTRFNRIEDAIKAIKQREENQKIEAVRLALENKALLEARTKSRTAQLSGLGLSLHNEKFTFHGIEVTAKQVEQLMEHEWIETLAIVTQKVSDKKVAIEKEEADEIARKEALKPDKEKLLNFIEAFTTPEDVVLGTPESNDLAKLIGDRFLSFKKWAKDQVEIL